MDIAADITSILNKISSGDGQAIDELLPLVYQELKKQAAVQMARERSDHTLQTTALVHDAYVRLLGSDSPGDWESQGHFYAAASNAMRRILVDHARSHARLKRGGDRVRVEITNLGEIEQKQAVSPEDLLEMDDALQILEASDAPVAELVRLRLYAGLSVSEAAKTMGVSRTVAYEHWDYAKSWFAVELGNS